MKARDIMTTDLVTVTPDTPIEKIALLLLEHRISAVPVTHGQAVLGIVSEGDLLCRPENGTEHARSWWLAMFTDSGTLAREYAKTHGHRAIDVMTRHVLSVSEDTDIGEIAKLLESHHIKRVPVMRDGKLVGIVSRANLLRALIDPQQRTALSTTMRDRDLHDAILNRARAEPWADVALLNLVVHGGDVELRGIVESEEQRNALRILAEGVPGVQVVRDHLEVVPYWSSAV